MGMDVTLGSLKRLTDVMAGQDKGSVDINGGAIDGTTIGASSATTGKFTFMAESVSNGLTAAGTNQATGLALTSAINNVTTAAASTGVVLPDLAIGQTCVVFHNGVSDITVYGNGSDTIDGTAGATGVTLTAGDRCAYVCVAANTVISYLLGAVSA